MDRLLEGRRVLVTGASSGIGEATARACLAQGAMVAGIARRLDRLQRLSAEHGLVPVAGDIAELGDARMLVGRAADLLGGLDVLVNSAGIARPGLIAEADPADWRAMFEVNVLGMLAITQAAIPHLVASDGGASIVNISSMSGRRVPTAAGGTYAATKFAVHALSETLRKELQHLGIRVTTISPGFVATELFDSLEDSDLTERYRSLATEVGMSPDDVAAAIVHVLGAPDSVTTVEVAMVSTMQDDGTYATRIAD